MQPTRLGSFQKSLRFVGPTERTKGTSVTAFGEDYLARLAEAVRAPWS